METQGANVMFNFLSHTAPAAPQEDWLTGSGTMCAAGFSYSTLWFVVLNEQNNHHIFIIFKKEGRNRMRTINL